MNKGIGIIADSSFGQRSVMDQMMMKEYSPCLREIKEGYDETKVEYQDNSDNCLKWREGSGGLRLNCEWCSYDTANWMTDTRCGQCCG